VLSSLLLAQQNSTKKDAPPPSDQKEQKEDAPLFKKKLGVTSSNTTKSSTTLGFNGIDPSGKVDQKMLATSPSSKDEESMKKMSANRPTAADVKAFLQEGGLKP
jgi:hypothetical protein